MASMPAGDSSERALRLRTRIKRTLIGLAAVLVGGFVLLNLLAYRHAHAMMHFTDGNARTREPGEMSFAQKIKVLFVGVNIPKPRSSASLTDLGPGTQSLRIECTNGVTLGAWYCPGQDTNPVVILFHGYSGEGGKR